MLNSIIGSVDQQNSEIIIGQILDKYRSQNQDSRLTAASLRTSSEERLSSDRLIREDISEVKA